MIRSSLGWRALALACLAPSLGQAQTLCFGSADGIPGTGSKAPDWWTSGATPFGGATSTFLDDPRWQGASGVSYIGDNGQFRALTETDVVGHRFFVLSWTVRLDSNGPGDRLYVGFWDETAAAGNVFRLERGQSTATAANGETYAGGAFNGRAFSRVGSAPWGLNNRGNFIPPPLPAWLKADTRVDVSCSSGICSQWAIRMRIPIDPTASVEADDPPGVKITAGSAFRFWYEIQDGSKLGSTLYAWPEGLPPASETASTIPPYAFPDPNTWSQLTDGATCVGDLSLDGTQLSLNTGGGFVIDPRAANVLRARPTNGTGDVLPGNALKATFRIANFGPTFGTDPEWKAVCSDVVGAPGPIPANGSVDLTCSWTPQAGEACSYEPGSSGCGASAGTRNPRQCMLVDLASAPGSGPYFFSRMSAYACDPRAADADAGGDAKPPEPGPGGPDAGTGGARSSLEGGATSSDAALDVALPTARLDAAALGDAAPQASRTAENGCACAVGAASSMPRLPALPAFVTAAVFTTAGTRRRRIRWRSRASLEPSR